MTSSTCGTSSEISMPAEQLDGLAEIFFEAKCAGLVRVPLSLFLTDPLGHLSGECGVIDAQVSIFEGEHFLPLLPKQVEAAQRIQEKWASDDARALAMMGNHLTLVPRF